MPVPFADPEDVAGIWRELSDAEVVVAENLLEDATALIFAAPKVTSRIASGVLTGDTLRFVAKHMVKRVMQNPMVLRQESFGSDDGQVSRTYDTAVSSGELYISDRELALISGGSSGGAFAIDTLPEVSDTPWDVLYR